MHEGESQLDEIMKAEVVNTACGERRHMTLLLHARHRTLVSA